MAQLFPASANTLVRLGFVLLLLTPIAVPAALMIAVRTPYQTRVGVQGDQPIPFSHEHHVGQLNIDCRYCHDAVEESTFAGIPPTKVCMTCHSQLWTNAVMLQPVRNSFANDKPIHWKRLYNLPDYVYFDHSIHVNKGIGCESCHGRVDSMPLTYADNALFMKFCLDCHRQPEKHLRPKDKITAMGWRPKVSQKNLGQVLIKKYHIKKKQLTDCSICHR